MNQMQVFESEQFGKIRGVTIDGEPWLAGKDVAAALGYQNASKALADHVDNEDKLNNESLSSLGQRGGWLINIRRQGTDYNMPTQRSMEMGLFRVKETAIPHSDGHVTVSKTPKVTGKGQEYFINAFLGKRSSAR